MATVTVTNLSSTSPLLLQEAYVKVPASGSITFERSSTDLMGMKSLQAAIADGLATASIAYSADELASGLVVDNAVPVAAASVQGGPVLLRVALAAGAGGSADDTVIYAQGAMPHKLRIVDHFAFVSTAVGGSSVVIRDQLAGGGVAYLTLASATTGRKTDATILSAPLADKTSTKGLIIRRTDNGVAVEVYLICRPEL